MAEFLIRVVDKGVAVDFAKRGDVIAAQPDGWPWTTFEKAWDEWRIVSVLGVPQTLVDAALATDPVGSAPPGQSKFRNWGIDFTQAPDPSLFQGVRTQAIISLTKNQAQAMLVKKP
jgi:hypothetical protein